jgi:hypothetical protein
MKLILSTLVVLFFACCNNEDKIDEKKEFDHVVESDRAMQKLSFDSLQNYSYLLYGNKINKPKSAIDATCFFVKENGRVYLITCNHVFTGKSPGEPIPADYPDTLYVRLTTKENPHYEFVPIDIKQYKKNVTDNIYNKPDLRKFEMKNIDQYYIYSIENFLNKKDILNFRDPVIIFGYPVSNIHFETEDEFKIRPPLKSQGNIDSKPEQIITTFFNHSKKYDSTLYAILHNQGTYFGEGYSGSPVFIKYPEKVVFAGVLNSGDPKTSQSTVIKPKFVIALFPSIR